MRVIRSFSAVAALAFLAACDLSTSPNVPDPIDPANDTYAASLGVNLATMTKKASGLYYKDRVVGTGTGAAALNDSIRVNYTLWLTNGNKIDSSLDAGGKPIEFKIGDPTVIPGFSEGFIGMLPGGERQLVVPTQLAWGAGGSSVAGKPPVPANANVVFEIQYLTRLSGAQ
jgi:FKBP-type peptidyl-prolyl cis-trans isomerase